MTHALRVLRNKWWHNDDNELEKVVDDEETLVDSFDLTDNLSTHEEISAATWDDTSGPTLGTPAIDGGVVEFTHRGIGSTVLRCVTAFTTYLTSLGVYKAAANEIIVGWVAGGGGIAVGTVTGAVAGADGAVKITPTGGAAVDLTGKYVAVMMPSGAVVRMGPLVYSGAIGFYKGPLLDDLLAADDTGAGVAWASETETLPEAADAVSTVAEYDLYAARPTQILRLNLRFTDPTNPDSDGYTP